VLNDHLNVTETARQRVLRAAADLGYSSQKSTTSLISMNGGGTLKRQVRVLRNIGFFFASVQGHEQPVTGVPFWSLVLYGAEQAATAAGIGVTYRSIDQWVAQAEALPEALRPARVDGIGSPTLVWGPGDRSMLWWCSPSNNQSYEDWPSRVMTAAMWRART